uniref:Transposase n=1 Tax=Heterorhabditis bacteriophora TaxID=37862 RepID=A0A1I7WKV0_HETBA
MVLADCSELIRVSAGKRRDQMPRHLISDAFPLETTAKGTGLVKITLLSLTLSHER